jgi:outer membrane lipoprotein carrier protein
MKITLLMKRYLAVLTALITLFPPSAYSAEKYSLQEILSAVKTGYASMEDLHADFSQRTYVASLKREEKGSGELFLKKKGGTAQFRFNYIRPKQHIISNGRNVWYYLPENRQVILTDTAKLFSGGNGMALSYLTGLGSLSEDFNIKLISETPDKKGNFQLELVPKKQNPAVAKLHLFISADAVEKAGNRTAGEAFFPVASSILYDHTGNRTTIEYSKIRINSGLTSDRFSFKPPAGVDIIKQ